MNSFIWSKTLLCIGIHFRLKLAYVPLPNPREIYNTGLTFSMNLKAHPTGDHVFFFKVSIKKKKKKAQIYSIPNASRSLTYKISTAHENQSAEELRLFLLSNSQMLYLSC